MSSQACARSYHKLRSGASCWAPSVASCADVGGVTPRREEFVQKKIDAQTREARARAKKKDKRGVESSGHVHFASVVV